MITYPLQVFRARMQQLNAKSSYRSLLDCAVKIWKWQSLFLVTNRREGIAGFYSGLLANLLRVVPSSSITLMTYEFVNSFMREHCLLE